MSVPRLSPALPPLLFDLPLLRTREARAAPDSFGRAILDLGESRLLERLEDVRRSFPVVLDLGARTPGMSAALRRKGARFVAACALAPSPENGAARVVAYPEALPFAPGSFDLVVSVFALHRVNDLPGALAQLRESLAPGGLFLAVLPGGRTLQELREVLGEAETRVTGGVSPRRAPMLDVRAAALLLQRGGFALPVADQESLALEVPDFGALTRTLRSLGEANALTERTRRTTRRAVFAEAATLYAARHARPDGTLRVTLDLIFLHGWRE